MGKDVGLHPQVVPNVLHSDDNAGLFGDRDQFLQSGTGGVSGLIVSRHVVGVLGVVAGNDAFQMAGLLVEFDIKLPGLRDRFDAGAARHEQQCVGSVRLRGFQRRFDAGDVLVHSAAIRAVEVGPTAQDGVDLHASLLGQPAALFRVGRRHLPLVRLHAFETSLLPIGEGLLSGFPNQRLLQFRFPRSGIRRLAQNEPRPRDGSSS